MTDDADIGHGAAFERGDGATPTEVFEHAGEVINVMVPKMSRDAIDATHSKSTGGWREFIPGLKQGEEFSLEVNYNPRSTVMANVHADFGSKAPRNYRAKFPDGSYWQFAALVIGIAPGTPTADKMVCEITFRPTGPMSIDVAAT